MAGFLRPELRAALKRWREAVIGVGVALLGAWSLAAGGLLAWIGVALLAAGAALVAAGVQRGRFRRAATGAGVVQVVEGQLAYFGPTDGGTMAIADISDVASRDAPPRWIIAARDGTVLTIPKDAVGAEALFDVFMAVPGLDPSTLVRDRAGHRAAGRIAPPD